MGMLISSAIIPSDGKAKLLHPGAIHASSPQVMGESLCSLIAGSPAFILSSRPVIAEGSTVMAPVRGILSSGDVVMGRGYAKLINHSNEWEAHELPAPRITGYTMSKDAGLVRTKFFAGNTRQRRRWPDGAETIAASFNITVDKLFVMEEFVNTQGYSWFTMGLVALTNVSSAVEVHTVRIKEDPRVGEVYGDNVTVSLVLEKR
jgi:hypothetical protein